jgi:hypothetical protein
LFHEINVPPLLGGAKERVVPILLPASMYDAAVNIFPFKTSQVAVPVKVGEDDNTTFPVPVFVVTPVPPLNTGKALDKVNDVADATPNVGVTKLGDVFKTSDPVPVEVATPVPPDTTFKGDVKLAAFAVIEPEQEIDEAVAEPRTGVISVGVLLKTT